MRSTTSQAVQFCNDWCNRSLSSSYQIQSLREAVQQHSSLVKEAASGKGVDRHLFALKCIAAKNRLEEPEFFRSESWKLLNHSILSTSNCGNPALRLFGFGPVVQDGFGIGYIIRDSGLQFTISSKHRQTERYVHTLNQFLDQIHALLSTNEDKTITNHRKLSLPTPPPRNFIPLTPAVRPSSNSHYLKIVQERSNSSVSNGDLNVSPDKLLTDVGVSVKSPKKEGKKKSSSRRLKFLNRSSVW
mmetsp:Transcript_10494/g.11971  ORF Transcript_10494/g.11971 Transcript_10494/m.11971 type:complete len:244 (+) Transcript_10494:1812-2543(+)